MCGIVGIAGGNPRDDLRGRALRMSARLVHRGPDDDGIWAEGDSALAIRRLSIIDLEGGHQPMIAPSGTVLVFNGEIYNFRALRRELEQRWEFRTRSDTEVVLAAYECDGIEALSRLEGMFAIALLDRRGNRLHLVRDRLGKKPLYYTDAPGPLLFASELKGLLAGLDAKPALDLQALHDFLTLRYVPAPATPWQGIRKLEPGERLELDLATGTKRLERWWRLDVVSADDEPADAAGEFERLLLDAVDKRLLAADVPVGLLLSGGIDSSAVGAAAVELGHREFHTFAVGFADGGEFSELAYAREVADHIGSRHHEVTVDEETFLTALPELVYQTDEPLADLATIPLHAVARLAREHVKVVLSGEGSDEVLAGYDLDALARRLHRLRPLRHVPRQVLAMAASVFPDGRGMAVRNVAAGGWSGMLGAGRSHMTWVFDEPEKAALWCDPDGLRPTTRLIDAWYAEAHAPDPIDRLLQVYCRSWLPEDLLMKADKATMATSLELRTPFLDHKLVEWAATLPLRWKVGSPRDGWRSKRILREFAERRLPASIITRPKQGFPVPAYRWLANGLAPWAAERLLRADAPITALLEREPMRSAVNRSSEGDLEAAHKVWSLLVLDHWLERWA
jgi:asparagine synthase (glutamine-hydrolysing)